MLTDIASILEKHRLWLICPKTGERATLFGADLSGANLSGATLSRANLSGANLSRAYLPYPIYQFFLGQYNAVATPHDLRIGCEVHSWQTWLSTHEVIGQKAGFPEDSILEHGEMIRLMHKLLTGGLK